ncbi:hypothetical protein AAY473_007651 [Plecturocebus cupreus]
MSHLGASDSVASLSNKPPGDAYTSSPRDACEEGEASKHRTTQTMDHIPTYCSNRHQALNQLLLLDDKVQLEKTHSMSMHRSQEVGFGKLYLDFRRCMKTPGYPGSKFAAGAGPSWSTSAWAVQEGNVEMELPPHSTESLGHQLVEL